MGASASWWTLACGPPTWGIWTWSFRLFSGYWVLGIATLPTLMLLRVLGIATLINNYSYSKVMLVAKKTVKINLKPAMGMLNCLDG